MSQLSGEDIYRRHSCNEPNVYRDIKLAANRLESYCDEGIDEDTLYGSEINEETDKKTFYGDIHQPPQRPPPHLPREGSSDNPGSHKQSRISHVHPKLPDYDAVSARSQALKYRRS